jgi:hypothetical protein
MCIAQSINSSRLLLVDHTKHLQFAQTKIEKSEMKNISSIMPLICKHALTGRTHNTTDGGNLI